MLLTDPLTAAVIGFVGVAIMVASVLFILQCGDCLRQNEYEQLSDDKTEMYKQATSAVQIRQVLASKDQQEKNITEVLYYIRSLPGSTLLTEYKLWGMGWRSDRTNFLASYQEHVNIISLVKKGPNCGLPWNRSGKEVFVKVLTSIKHPLIQLITKPDILFDENLAIVLSFFSPEGSLRDKIFGCEPTNTWDKKYVPSNGTAFNNRDIAKYGRQILDALRFLHASRIPYTHLHSGNVIIRSGTARLTQLENPFLNVERQNEDLFRQYYKLNQRNIESSIEFDIIAFGIVLYEMMTGKQLKHLSQLDDVQNVSTEVMKIVQEILRNPEKKLPTIQELLNNQFFAGNSSVQLPEPIVYDKKTLVTLSHVEASVRELTGVFKPPTRVASVLTPRGGNRRTQQPEPEPYRGFEPGPNQPVRPQAAPVSSQATSPAATRPPAQPQPAAKTVSVPTSPSVPRANQAVASPRPAATPTPAPAPKAAVPAPKPAAPTQQAATPKAETHSAPNALLMSIEGFSKNGLKKTVTNDRSAPKF